jgi:hypothetical protein
MKDNVTYTVYIDASYVLNGIRSKTRRYSQGTNGDIWTKLYQVTEHKRLNLVKVKSHVTDGNQWTAHNMTVEAYIHNELADEVCTQASKTTARTADNRKLDGKQYALTAKAAARIAAIEASIWANNPIRVHYDGTDYTALRQARTTAVKRKFDETMANTSGGDAHETFTHEGWIRCRHCPARARPDNTDYWHHNKCTRAAFILKPTAREQEHTSIPALHGIARTCQEPTRPRSLHRRTTLAAPRGT